MTSAAQKEENTREKRLTFRADASSYTPESFSRLDRFLTEALTVEGTPYARSRVQKWIAEGRVSVDGTICLEKNAPVIEGALLSLVLPAQKTQKLLPEEMPLVIVYEDADLLILDKPRGLTVHPGAGQRDHTLVNALLAYLGDDFRKVGEDPSRPGIVHRIDKYTSGLLAVAKTDAAFTGLKALFMRHDIERSYWALVYNGFEEDSGVIDKPIGRDPQNRLKRKAGGSAAREARTKYRVLERIGVYTLIEARLETGRTHQIRVHLSWSGHPVVGDPLYGPVKDRLHANGQVLHAKTLGFRHPVTGEMLSFESPLPAYFEQVLQKARRAQGGRRKK